jgi:hypothetical protein
MEDIDPTLEKSLADKDIRGIRNVLSTFITEDQGFSRGIFDKNVKYCCRKGFDVFEDFKGEDFKPQFKPEGGTNWTKEYYAEQRTEFLYNFSRERLSHLKQVGKYLFSSEEESKKKETHIQNPAKPTRRKKSRPYLLPIIATGIIVIILWLLLRKR